MLDGMRMYLRLAVMASALVAFACTSCSRAPSDGFVHTEFLRELKEHAGKWVEREELLDLTGDLDLVSQVKLRSELVDEPVLDAVLRLAERFTRGQRPEEGPWPGCVAR